MIRVGIFAATRWECQAVQHAFRAEARRHRAGYHVSIGRRGSCEVHLIRTGIGPGKVRSVCQAAFQNQPMDVAISSGLACALTASSVGELFVGTEVMTVDDVWSEGPRSTIVCDSRYTEIAVRAAQAAGLPARWGRFVSLPRIIWRAEEKHRVARNTGAMALDMESAAIGEVAAAHRIPFAVIRTVSDLLDEDLPIDFNLFLERSHWPKAMWACVARPAGLLELRRMRTQMRTASMPLTRVFEKLLDEVA